MTRIRRRVRATQISGLVVGTLFLVATPWGVHSAKAVDAPRAVVQQPPLSLPPADEHMKAFSQAQTWEVVTGKTIALHYVLEPFRAGDEKKDDNDIPVYNTPEEARAKLAMLETAYAQAQQLLGVGPAPYLVPLYLFPTAKAQGDAFGVEPYAGAATQQVTVTCRDGNLDHLKSYLSHELTHILIRQVADPLPDFLQEGVAVWAQTLILAVLPDRIALLEWQNGKAPDSFFPSMTKKSLKDLSGMSSEKLDGGFGNGDGASFVEYIISTGTSREDGVARLRKFLAAVRDTKGSPYDKMKAASKSVLGMELDAAEKAWRARAPKLDAIKRTVASGFQNIDFSQGTKNWSPFGNYRVSSKYLPDEKVMLMTWPGKESDPASAQYGHWLQYLPDVSPYHGKRIRIEITVVDAPRNADSALSLILSDKDFGYFYNVPIAAPEGTAPGGTSTFALTVEVPKTMKTAMAGVGGVGPLQLRLRSFTVTEVGPDVPLTPLGRKAPVKKKQ